MRNYKIILLSSIIILVVLLPLIDLFNLKIQQQIVQTQVQSNIVNQKISTTYTLKIETHQLSKQLKWKNNHEFYKDGFICDIVSKYQKNQYTYIVYLHDKKETAIEKEISDLFKTGSENHKQPISLVLKIQSLKYLLSENDEIKLFPSNFEYAKQTSENYTSIGKNVPYPPPDLSYNIL